MIISISGRMGSGKDEVGKIIRYLLYKEFYKGIASIVDYEELPDGGVEDIPDGFVVKKFAEKLKQLVCILLGCTREQLEDSTFKNTPIGEAWDRTVYHVETVDGTFRFSTSSCRQQALIDLSHFSEYYIISEVQVVKEHIIMTPRLLLQLLGTDCGRAIIHPDIWVNSLFSEYTTYKKSPNWIITDTRFLNELREAKKYPHISIMVQRPDLDAGIDRAKLHQSETALDHAEFDHKLINKHGIPELVEEVRLILLKANLITE